MAKGKQRNERTQIVKAFRSSGQPQWSDIHTGMGRMSADRGEWAGCPMPVKGMRMIVHPSYPFHDTLSKTFMPEPSMRVCSNKDVDESVQHRNTWRSYRDGKQITISRDSKGFFWHYSGSITAGPMLIQTIAAARAWDFAAELRAQETLKRHLTDWAFKCYLMTGSFLETSKRSKVSYMFRRLRPTLAMTANPDSKGRDKGVRILAALCLHPIGYYDGSWGGALVPTDDVLAHLLMMRGCEAKFWAHSNQHEPLAPEAGL